MHLLRIGCRVTDWIGNVLDYAGGTVVHITAGIAALVAAIVLGSRKGFFKKPCHRIILPLRARQCCGMS